jgi:hypothetical protein
MFTLFKGQTDIYHKIRQDIVIIVN